MAGYKIEDLNFERQRLRTIKFFSCQSCPSLFEF